MSSGAFGAFAKCSSVVHDSHRSGPNASTGTSPVSEIARILHGSFPLHSAKRTPRSRGAYLASVRYRRRYSRRGLFSFDSDCEERCDIHATTCGNDPQYFFSCLRRCARYENKSQDGKDIQENTSDGNVSIIHHSFSSEKANDLRTTSRLPDTAWARREFVHRWRHFCQQFVQIQCIRSHCPCLLSENSIRRGFAS